MAHVESPQLKQLEDTPGILRAQIGATNEHHPAWVPDAKILDLTIGMLAHTTEPAIRVVLGAYTFVAMRENGQDFGVMFPTGHGVAKSIR